MVAPALLAVAPQAMGIFGKILGKPFATLGAINQREAVWKDYNSQIYATEFNIMIADQYADLSRQRIVMQKDIGIGQKTSLLSELRAFSGRQEAIGATSGAVVGAGTLQHIVDSSIITGLKDVQAQEQANEMAIWEEKIAEQQSEQRSSFLKTQASDLRYAQKQADVGLKRNILTSALMPAI